MHPTIRAINGLYVTTQEGSATVAILRALSSKDDPRIPRNAVIIEFNLRVDGQSHSRFGQLQVSKESLVDVDTLRPKMQRAAQELVKSGAGETVYLD